ncbi:hypothetical protein L1987_76911 [Smallanthus sonchifolius]|uniref:Uncharacterized protein n=1 Tax=Smallanthus sonchifolius TaxID=185202 RepID=A0ACB8ZCX2_9ASTR|nr:hypothetical protein L1987_76911 [Smallanthus sonchifolius]
MARWVTQAIKNRFCPILEQPQLKAEPVDLQDLLLRITFDNICGFVTTVYFPGNYLENEEVAPAWLGGQLEPKALYTWKNTCPASSVHVGMNCPLSIKTEAYMMTCYQALSETLRLYPSVPEDSKHVVSDDVLPDGTFVLAGSSVTYSIYSVGRMKSTWGRLPRISAGEDLAYLQMKSIAAAVLLRHRLAVAAGHKVEQKMSLTLFMKYGLKVNVFKRDLRAIMERVKEKGGN